MHVTVEKARQFAAWKGKRLPTALEWERAARGTDGKKYPWGNAEDPTLANVVGSALKPVKSYVAYGGVYQMAGNAWEIVEGNVTPSAGALATFASLKATPNELWIVIRGGAFNKPLAYAVSYESAPDPRTFLIGGHRVPVRQRPVTKTWDATTYQARHSYVFVHGENLVELLEPQPGERILDLGCGSGQLTAKIAESGAEVWGIDQSAEMIAEARRNFPDLQFEVGDAASFTVPKPFDAIFSNAALHWVKDAEGVAASVARALLPGGRFVLEMGGKGNVQGGSLMQFMR